MEVVPLALRPQSALKDSRARMERSPQAVPFGCGTAYQTGMAATCKGEQAVARRRERTIRRTPVENQTSMANRGSPAKRRVLNSNQLQGALARAPRFYERVTGIGPVPSPWKGDVLPLYDTRVRTAYHTHAMQDNSIISTCAFQPFLIEMRITRCPHLAAGKR